MNNGTTVNTKGSIRDFGHWQLIVKGDGTCGFKVKKSFTNRKLAESLREAANVIENVAREMEKIIAGGEEVIQIAIDKDAANTLVRLGYIEPIKFNPHLATAPESSHIITYALEALLGVFSKHFAKRQTA